MANRIRGLLQFLSTARGHDVRTYRYPISVFRFALFAALIIHFFPTFVGYCEESRLSDIRTDEWNSWLFHNFELLPHVAVIAIVILTLVFASMAAFGVATRVSALGAGLGFFVTASANGIGVQTLALPQAWSLVVSFVIFFPGRKEDLIVVRPRQPLIREIVLFQLTLAVMSSGIEKVAAGWLYSNAMGVLFSFPKGLVTRGWVRAFDHHVALTRLVTKAVPVVEIIIPPLLLAKPSGLLLIVYEVFFLLIELSLQIPPLFYLMFAAGGLLALDDSFWLNLFRASMRIVNFRPMTSGYSRKSSRSLAKRNCYRRGPCPNETIPNESGQVGAEACTSRAFPRHRSIGRDADSAGERHLLDRV